MKNLLSSTGLVSVVLFVLLCALCEAYKYKVTPPDAWCEKATRLSKGFNRAVILASKRISKQNNQNYQNNQNNENNVTFFINGMPANNIQDYDSEDELQNGQGYYWLPSVLDNQILDVIKPLTEAKFGLCWTISGSISVFTKVDTVLDLKTSPVISSLFCFRDVLTPLPITFKQRSKRDNFQWECESGGNKLIQESIYTDNSIMTRNITNSTECYAKLPCFHCEQEVIQIRKGKKVTWNIIEYRPYLSCTREQDAIPAATVMECFQNGGRFIKSIHAPDRLLRCVSTKCEDLPKEYPVEVNSIAINYNNCDLDYAENEMMRQKLRDVFAEGAMYQSMWY